VNGGGGPFFPSLLFSFAMVDRDELVREGVSDISAVSLSLIAPALSRFCRQSCSRPTRL
jgi:hypothetical protein